MEMKNMEGILIKCPRCSSVGISQAKINAEGDLFIEGSCGHRFDLIFQGDRKNVNYTYAVHVE